VLKDNPNVQDNLIKIEKDRQQLYQALSGLKNDLLTLNYHTFAYNITEQLQFQDLLHKKRQLEKETSSNVKTLAEDYKKEYQEYLTETKEAQQEILRLREEVAQQKVTQSFRSKYQEKDLDAGYASEQRNRRERETELLSDINELEKAIETEKLVNKRIEAFMTQGRDKILKDNEEWKQKTEKDRKELLLKIDNVSKKKEAAKLKLEGFTSEQDTEKKRNVEREKEEREREARLKQEREDNERKTQACEIIAREYLKYKELTVKTKGKKGKKKGKK
jgi:hypothetical protein